jgi:C4-dicarboxylate transporter DctQ subunit
MSGVSVLAAITAVLQTAVGGVMLSAVLLNFTNVVARYVFSRPIAAAEEILQLMDVWVVMLGAAVITREHGHLNMDLGYEAMPPPVRRVVDVFITALEIVLSVYVIAQAGRIIAVLYTTDTRTVAAGIPVALMYVSIALGFGCAVLFLIHRLRRPASSTRAAS